MEEKERYEYFFGTNTVKDNTNKEFLSYKRVIDTLNQQDKRMKETESKLRVSNSLNASLSLEHSELKKQYDSQEKLLSQKLAENSILTLENQQLKQQLAITEKALESASETIKQMCGKPLWIGGNMLPPEPKDSKYFKDIAKEMLENE